MDEQQRLLLWQWSSAVQVTSLAMIAVFFALLARFNPRAELRWWTLAWLANLVALSVTLMYWYFQPASILPVVRAAYMAAKLAFLLLLIQGGWTMMRPGARLLSTKALVVIVVAYGVAAAAFLSGVNSIGLAQSAVMGLLLAAFAIIFFRSETDELVWLALGFAIRGVLALAEGASYLLQILPADWGMSALRAATASFLSASSSFDTGAEWLVVLGCVLAVSERAQRELSKSNTELVTAHQDLRRLADKDPLTTLANRRALPEVFRAVQPEGAILLFFDLDGFKQINDRHGHLAGDHCLRAFAGALRDSFRPDDYVIRYGGDEFLVVAQGLDRVAALARVDDLKARLTHDPWEGLICSFSVGMSELPAGGQPEIALKAADAAMYESKGTK
jgi:diguanylate cyclase (GGDEF)-like protein